MTFLNSVQSNIPVNPSFFLQAKEVVHNFFRRPMVVKIFTYLPPISPFLKYRELASLITKCHKKFGSSCTTQMCVKVYGGDKLETLQTLEKSQKTDIHNETFINFSLQNSLDAARALQTIANGSSEQNKQVGILNLANRLQPGGVGLAPYGGSQEEFLVRRSNLAWGLDKRFGSKEVHEQLSKIRIQERLVEPFQHHIPYFGAVVSKNVTFIDQNKEDNFDVISAAAPDMRKGSDEYRYLRKHLRDTKAAQLQILENKIKAIFEAAIAEKIDYLVLGAFGCGCFNNETQEVAQIFANLLTSDAYKNRFKQITFAITEQSKFDIFKTTIKPQPSL